ncbi:MAG: hypothetical protein F4138_08010 [Acidimicrobiia bacterium]|nr:hypothetical protein [Acidimicrobiia bacterium]
MAQLTAFATQRLQALAQAADLHLPAAKLWQGVGVTALGGAGLGALQAGVIGALLGSIALVAGGLLALWANRHRHQQKIAKQLPGFLEAIARGLRTGLQLGPATIEAATNTTPPLAAEVAPLAEELRRGVRNADAFEQWARRRTDSGIKLAAAAMAFAASAGGARARAIDSVATTLRDRVALELETRSLTSQARASALIIAMLPVGFMIIATSTGARAGSFLFTTHLGLMVLAIGLGLDVIGALWMRRIVNTSG